MKTKMFFLTAVFFVVAYTGIAQVPEGFNYQAVVRDATGAILINQTIPVKIALLANSPTGSMLWEEQHTVISNQFGLISLVLGTGTRTGGTKASFSSIDWSAQTVYIRTSLQYPGTTWNTMGTTQIWSVPYSLVAGKTTGINPGAKIISENDAGTEALFEVKRKDGQTVFAVYPDAVNVFVPNSGVKAAKGGFAVGGFGGKGSEEYFWVSADSVRINIDPDPSTKAAKGGFAVGGYGMSKGVQDRFFNVTGATTVNTVAASPQILWYPNKNALLAGNVHIAHVDSVGNYSTAFGYQSRAIGNYSQAFGYKATAFGDYSTSIGKRSIAGAYKSRHNAFALGNATQATGEDSYAFGSAARATGEKSFAFGSVGLDDSGNPTTTPTTASGSYSVAIGMGAQATAKGAMAVGIGSMSYGATSSSFGFYSTANGSYATALGYKSYASGYSSGAFGSAARAEGYASLALGRNSYTTGYYSVAVGDSAKAVGNYSGAFGRLAKAKGQYSVAVGYNALTKAAGSYSVAIGAGAIASGNYALSFGNNSQATNTNSLAIGNSSVSSGVNASAMGYQSQANGELSLALGSYYSYSYSLLPYFSGTKGESGEDDSKGDFIIRPPIIAPIFKTITFNRANIADGKYSIAIGNGNYSNNGGLTLGSNNNATAFGAVAVGVSNSATNTNTFAAGYNNRATGYYATAFGNNTYSKAYGSFVIGQFNEIAGDSTKWVSTDPVFVVGNGLSESDRSNAVTIYKNGRSIFYGEHANVSLNDKNYGLRYVPGVGFQWTTSVYGIKSYVNRSDAGVDYYYSGYFYDTGTEGTYKGLYADERTGGSIDVAEYIYDSNNNTEPADVVVADPSNKESVIKSSRPYQSSVVGVISTKPHMTMGMELVTDEKTGEPLKNSRPAARLALTGRVPVKVTAENGAIQPGDMLTTSSVPGHAMKWTLLDVAKAKDFNDLKSILSENETRRNAVLGKAVEGFSGTGTGTIMVLISLQ